MEDVRRGRHAAGEGVIPAMVAWRAFAIVVGLVLGATGGAARASGPPEDVAKMTAQAWLYAAYKQPPSMSDAVRMTELLLWYEGVVYLDAGSAAPCKKIGARGTIADAAAVQGALECLRHGSAPYVGSGVDWSAVGADALPKPLARYKAKLAALAKTHTLVLAHVKQGKTEDWAVLAVSFDDATKAARVAALVAAHKGR